MPWWNPFSKRTAPALEVHEPTEAAKSERSSSSPMAGSITELLRRLTQGERDERILAAKALGETGRAQAVQPLILTLTNEVTKSGGGDASFQETVSDSLVKLGAVAIKPLIAAISATPADLRSQAIAAKVLKSVAQKEVADAIVEPLFVEFVKRLRFAADIRKNAAQALGELSDARGIEPLLNTATQDPDTGVRDSAAKALVKLGFAAVEQLTATLVADNSSERKHVAANVLGALKDPRAVLPLTAALTHFDPLTRKNAAEVLGKIGDTSTVEPLILMLQDKDPGVRRIAAAALGNIRDIRAVDALVAALNDTDVDMRACAANALANVADKKAAQPLIAALKAESSASVGRAGMVTALLKFRDSYPTEVFDAALIFGDSATRLSELKAVARPVGPWAAGALIVALDDKDAQVRERVVELLGETGDISALKPLIVSLKDYRLADRATKSLVQIGTSAVETLIAALGYGDTNTKIRVAEVLVMIGDSRAIDPLVALLRDANLAVRKTAIESLTKLGDARAVEPLITMLEDGDSNLRTSASVGLAKIGDERAVEPLAKAARAGSNSAFDALVILGKSQALKELLLLAIERGWPIPIDLATRVVLDNKSAIVPSLKNALETAKVLSVRRRIVELLIRTGEDSVKRLLPTLILESLSQEVRAAEDGGLKFLAGVAGIDAELLEMATAALGCAARTSRHHSGGGNYSWDELDSYDGGMSAILELSRRRDNWANAILYRVAKKKDISITLKACFGERTETLSFGREREAARQELIRRGLGDSDPIALLPN